MKRLIQIILIALLTTPIGDLYGQGRVGINVDTPNAELHVAGQVIIDSGFIAGATHPEAIESMFYYNDSIGAVRYGNAGFNGLPVDSMGYGSLAGGYSSVASGPNSLALGYYNQASGQTSVALGSNTEATGFFSFAMGQQSRATASNAVAMGRSTKAFGSRAVALGNSTRAVGYASTALGSLTIANADYSTAIGRYNWANGYGSLVVGVYNDSIVAKQSETSADTPLFIVGNGVSSVGRRNAMVVYFDGLTEIDDLSVGEGTEIDQIQSGTSTIGANAGGGVKAVTISFPDGAFLTTPRVICTVKGGDYVDTFVVSTRSISTTSFTVNIYRVDNSGGNWGQDLKLDWIAID